MKNKSLSKPLQRIVNMTFHQIDDLSGWDFKIACYLLILLHYQLPQNHLVIYLEEIASGIDLFTDKGERIVFAEGTDLAIESIRESLVRIRESKILKMKRIGEEQYRIW